MIINNRRKDQVLLQKTDLRECARQLNNPGRGWYQIYTFYLPEEIDYQSLIGSLNPDESLALIVVNIGNYKEKELDREALERFEEILLFFHKEKKDVILRVVYDSEGRGIEREPLLLSHIERHITQLTPMIQAYTQTIFVLQGLLVGRWGEMHSSKFLSPFFLNKLKMSMEAAAGKDTWLAVRRPMYWRMLHQEANEMNRDREFRMGLFDDAILGSDTHMGTFGNKRRRAAGWNASWCTEEELRFEEKLCNYVPNGGEAVCPVNGIPVSADKVIRRLRQMHVSYLNSIHDPKLIARWKVLKSGASFPWNQSSLYEYVGAHMGYRYRICDGQVTQDCEEMQIEIEIENRGFAPCYEQYRVVVEIRENAETVFSMDTGWDLRTLLSGDKITYSKKLPVLKGDLYVSVTREKDGRRLYFANKSDTDGRVYIGKIL